MENEAVETDAKSEEEKKPNRSKVKSRGGGFRQAGKRKQMLIHKFFKLVGIAQKNGVNIDFLVKNYLGIKNWNNVPTSKVSGLISECRQFLVDSGVEIK